MIRKGLRRGYPPLDPTPYTLHPAPYTLHPGAETPYLDRQRPTPEFPTAQRLTNTKSLNDSLERANLCCGLGFRPTRPATRYTSSLQLPTPEPQSPQP